MKLDKIKLNDLISPDYNPRQITDTEMLKLENSIKEFGFVNAIIINLNNNHIISRKPKIPSITKH